jgi:hypothetical protein
MKWTAKTRQSLHLFVRQDKNDPADARATPSAAIAWSAARALCGTEPVTYEGDPSQSAAVDRLRAQFASAAPPAFDPAIEPQRAAWILAHAGHERSWVRWGEWGFERALVALWLATGGVAATLDAALSEGGFWLDRRTTYIGATKEIHVRFLDQAPHGSAGFVEALPFSLGRLARPTPWAIVSALRCQLDAMGADAFASGARAGLAAFDRLPESDTWGRAALAYAFAREPAFGARALALADRAMKDTFMPGEDFLVLALPDAGSVQAWGEEREISNELAYDLAERFGEEAAPILRGQIKRLEDSSMSAGSRKRLLAPFEGALKVLAAK